jgi:pimeloyl-ACP methyl ester carboxylesterase
MKRIIPALAVSIGLLALSLPGTAAASSPVPWHKCPEPAQRGFQCVTIRVPLDYGNPDSPKIEVAWIRHRATDPQHRLGTLFYEPGGPGVGGTTFMPPFFDNFPAPLRAHFDIISWDPRGVGTSTAVQCFASKAAEEHFFAGSPTRAVNGFPLGDDQMKTWIGRYRGFGARCERRNGDLLKHISTVDTARDLELMRRLLGEPKMNYLGTSYGTIVGAVYANLFPSRVRAMTLDGVVNPIAWQRPQRAADGGRVLSAGLRFRSDVESAKTLRKYLDLCGRTDTAHCAFSAGSPEATRQKFTELLAKLPVALKAGQTNRAQAIAETVHRLYVTFRWKPGAMILQNLWEHGPSAPPLAVRPLARRAASEVYGGEEQEMAIACGEVPSPPAGAFPGLDAFSRRRSGEVGPFWAWDYEPCSTWPVRSAHPYRGRWDSPTADPVLVIGNTFDPATPLRGAKAMAGALDKARLLTVDGYGHTVLLNPSSCADRYESRYFISGSLPPKGARCRQDGNPFGD